MKNTIWPINILAVMLILIQGCSGSGKKEEGITIAVIPMGTTHEFWKSIHAGAVTASQELGVDIIWKGPLKEDDREEQIQIVETFIAADVDAIVLSPIDDRALIRPVRDAKKLGIPTIIFNSDLEGEFHESFVSTDNYRGGALGAELVGELLGGKGKLIHVLYQEG
ncbi:MAG: substrate-binding domain-containing protein, partial [Candidatus Latescibacteria bacterium]|nr:substrate-binding domain-containing protein [Candidatus Latescibacterota bacterium]